MVGKKIDTYPKKTTSHWGPPYAPEWLSDHITSETLSPLDVGKRRVIMQVNKHTQSGKGTTWLIHLSIVEDIHNILSHELLRPFKICCHSEKGICAISLQYLRLICWPNSVPLIVTNALHLSLISERSNWSVRVTGPQECGSPGLTPSMRYEYGKIKAGYTALIA